MLYISGIAITIFLVFILSGKKNKSTADTILLLWLSFAGLHLLLYYLYITANYIKFPYLLGLEIPLPLVHGPFLYLYTSALTSQKNSKKIQFLHFTPFALALFSLLPFITLSSPEKIEVYRQGGKGYELLVNIIFGAVIASGILYTILSLQKLARHRRVLPNQFSYTEKINLNWLTYLIIGSGIIWLLVIFSNDTYIFSAVAIYLLFIGYFGIKQVGIFTNKTPETGSETFNNLVTEAGNINLGTTSVTDEVVAAEPDTENSKEYVKYEKSKLRKEEIDTIHLQLSELMQTGKFYKNPELSLTNVAQKINVHPNTLSQVINTVEQKNFYDYINLQRINEFKRLVTLPENQKFTLLSLAFECGFNSKTSFNRNFKKVTGLSPTEYLTQNNIIL